MSRIILVLVVAVLLVAMTASSAFAAGKGGINAGGDCRAGAPNTNPKNGREEIAARDRFIVDLSTTGSVPVDARDLLEGE